MCYKLFITNKYLQMSKILLYAAVFLSAVALGPQRRFLRSAADAAAEAVWAAAELQEQSCRRWPSSWKRGVSRRVGWGKFRLDVPVDFC